MINKKELGTEDWDNPKLDFLGKFLSEERIEGIERVLEQRTRWIVPVLENIYDQGNVHAALRTAENLGIQDFHNINSVKVKTSHRVTRGCEKWMTYYNWKESTSCIKFLKDQGYKICSTHLNESSSSLYDIEIDGPMAIFFGNEKDGVSEEAVRESDFIIKIPNCGFSQSLNVSVASGICLHWLMNKFRNQGFKGLEKEERKLIRLEWYIRSLKNGQELLSAYENGKL